MSFITDETLGVWFDSTPLPMWVLDSETLRFLEVNAAAVERYGYSRAEFLGMRIIDIRPDGDVPEFLAGVAGRLANTGQIWRHRTKSGAELSVQISSVPITIAGRSGFLVAISDVTELSTAARDLAIQRELLKDFLSTNSGLGLGGKSGRPLTLPSGSVDESHIREAFEERNRMFDEAERLAEVGSWRYDLVADYAVWSENMYRVLGVRKEDTDPLKLRGFVEHFVHPEDRERVASAVRAAVAERKPYEIEYRVVHPGGEERHIRARGLIVQRDGQGNPTEMTGTVQDVTERKRADAALQRTEEQLRQSQRIEAIGRLAGGVAHDFNNILTVISGYGELLLSMLPKESPQRAGLQEIVDAGRRAAALTHQLLAFSRRQVLAPQIISLNEVVSGMESLLRRLIGEDIDFVTSFAPDLGFVMADKSQMEQVIMNLAVNARDAMPAGGQLLLETRSVYLDEEYVASAPTMRPGPHVMLAVSDTGQGMDAETRARIFEPFFTTKEVGKGTGLGLATVYGIIKQSGGHIWVYSEPGRGATFKIYFPRAHAPSAPSRPVPVVAGSLAGNETVLVVEDDDVLRRFIREVLGPLGYRVLEAGSGDDAIASFGTTPDEIHLLLTDVVMPGLSGREAADTLLQTRPKMKVLYISGYTEDGIVQHGRLETGVNFLPKPFGPDSLARRVRMVLDAADE